MKKKSANKIYDEDVLDVSLLGLLIRRARMRSEFNSGAEFCAALYTWGGVGLSVPALYRIENGKQPPTVEQLFAIAIVTSRGKGTSPVDALSELGLDKCFCSYYKTVIDSKHDGVDIFNIPVPRLRNTEIENYDSLFPGFEYIAERIEAADKHPTEISIIPAEKVSGNSKQPIGMRGGEQDDKK